ncbi:RNA-dependent RNA polymerase [Wenzhou narna-like virus 3]|uniref:RNA-dependent RNA polymerase n=1 Tax=Wenzhou narna-like virus 3 TaxID=1923578 RepID=UPI00090BB1DF|nr:RNA-dependent RNA polymerase [Wenzhou narna-like virus 3]APG77162.1 RNA-dependent RNA polymerase [Wenzhou narna-like virus 3]
MLSTLRSSCAGTDPAFLGRDYAHEEQEPYGPPPSQGSDDDDEPEPVGPPDGRRSQIEAYLYGLKQAARVESVWEHIYNLYEMIWSPLTSDDRGLWAYLAMNDQLESYLKYKTALNLSQTWRQEELPEEPAFLADIPSCYRPPKYGLSWSTSDQWRSLNRGREASTRYQELAYALYQGKAGALPMRDELVDSKVDSVVRKLTTPVRTPTQMVMGRKVGLRQMRAEVTRTVREVYGPPREEERETPGAMRLASVKSAFQSSRGEGGAHQFVCQDAAWDMALGFPQLVGFTRGCDPRPIYGTSAEDWIETVEVSRRSSWNETMACYPVGLVEPFKVRVITRGAAHHYHLSRRWQKSLWRPLAEHPTFQLVGRSMSHKIMDDMVTKAGTDQRVWMSGDYQAATDNFDPELSNHCLAEVCRSLGVPYEDQRILRESLTGHEFYDPDTKEHLGRQARGQLMGSPVSFPILCLLNAALTRLAFEVAGRERAPLRDQAILINGDDLLCRVYPREYKAWKIVTQAGGLTPSLGKCFRHRHIATINSEMWRVSRRSEILPDITEDSEAPTARFNYYHCERARLPLEGLAYGSIKGASGTTDKARRIEGLSIFSPQNVRALSSMGKCWEEYLNTLPSFVDQGSPLRRRTAVRRYRRVAYDHLWKVNYDRLTLDLPNIAWCLPLRYGGVGLPLPPRDSPMYHRRLARPQQLGMAHLLAALPNERARLHSVLRETRPTYSERMTTSGRRYVKVPGLDDQEASIEAQSRTLGINLTYDLRRGVREVRARSAFWALTGSEPIPGADGDSFKKEWNRIYRRAGTFRAGVPRWEPIRDIARLARLEHRDYLEVAYDLPTPVSGAPSGDTGNGHEEDLALEGVWWSGW